MKFLVTGALPKELTSRKITICAGKIWRSVLSEARRRSEWDTVTLAFLSAKEMQRLNKQFRGKNYATDVLSFAPVEEGSMGELAFCVDVLRRQAREHDLSFEQEFAYMLIHGLLHLLGFDHEAGAAEARKMFKIQDAVFADWRA